MVLVVGILMAVAGLQAQPLPPDAARQLAILNQDVAQLRQQMGQVMLQVEALQRENAELRRRLETASAGLATVVQLQDQITALRAEYREADARNRREVVAELGRQIESLASQTDTALKALARSIEATPTPVAVTFSDDFPETGVVYTVQRGDTLSTIARRHNSTVRDIQNANRIADPSRLTVGQTLFIPQRRNP